MDVDHDTFELWKSTHPEFIRALRAGREQADAKVARALFRRAVGWGTLEEEVVSRKVKLPDGSETIQTVTVPYRKRYPPDVGAIALWLKNRHPSRWRVGDALDQNQATGIQVQVDLSALSTEDLKLALRLGAVAGSPEALRLNSIAPGGNGGSPPSIE